MTPEWQRWEDHCNKELGLEGTVASGATWKDKGDGTTRDNYDESWPLLIDAKTTKAASYSLKHSVLNDLLDISLQFGKFTALPLRFLDKGRETDWVVVPFDDYAYLVERHRKAGEFIEEERELIRAVKKTVKGEAFGKALERILSKMGGDS